MLLYKSATARPPVVGISPAYLNNPRKTSVRRAASGTKMDARSCTHDTTSLIPMIRRRLKVHSRLVDIRPELPPFRPDSRHKQKGSSTGLEDMCGRLRRARRICWYDVEVWCGHVFGFLCGKTLPPASMDYASSVHFRLTCC